VETILYIVHVLVCLAMLPIILLQSGKGGGVSATFGGGGSGTVFGSRGASTFLQRLTSAAAIIFMVTSMSLSWFASQSRSVVGDTKEAAKKSAGTNQTAMPKTGSAATQQPAQPESAPDETAP
jgi:preprotein translocase subunit SecG